jgi:ubiquinone/menaquinone biosynthesis C-methylase UbiE
VSEYLEAVMSGRPASIGAWHEYLRAFHRAYPDATTLPMMLLRTSGGESSYDRFAAFVNEGAPGARDVLDIGCGDGTVLARLTTEYAAPLNLFGVDLSESEIVAAQRRLPQAQFAVGDAGAMEYPAQSFDAVISHLSFALIPDLANVFARAWSMLRDGGVLAFATEEIAETSFSRLAAAAFGGVRAVYASFTPTVEGSGALGEDAEMIASLRRAGFTSNACVERVELRGAVSAGDAWRIAQRAYPFGMLPAPAMDAAQRAVMNFVGDDPFDLRMTIRMVRLCR